MGSSNEKASEFVATIKAAMQDAGLDEDIIDLLEDEDLSTPLDVIEAVREYVENGTDGLVRFHSEARQEFDEALDDVIENRL